MQSQDTTRKQVNDGGPAYPTMIVTQKSIEHDGIMHPSGNPDLSTIMGMSLRDWFAGQALGNMLEGCSESIDFDFEIIAEISP